MAEAVAAPAALPPMGAASRSIVEREFAWSVIVQKHLELYDELLLRAKGKGRRAEGT
jgi:hypothetical protein